MMTIKLSLDMSPIADAIELIGQAVAAAVSIQSDDMKVTGVFDWEAFEVVLGGGQS